MQPRGNGDNRTHPLVGRTAEVSYLEQCLETALTGERQVERLPEVAQYLLEVASVVGVEFSAAAVAAGLQAAVEEVDHQCETLARQGQFIQEQGTEEWPDDTLSERYSFRHALYHAVLYDRLTETQRVRLHRRIAERKEAAYGERAGEIAAELASHFAAGRDPQKASRYHGQAGETALRRNAYQEAMDHFTKGVTLLQTLPDTPERTHHEIQLHLSYAMSLIVTKGSAASEVEQAYTHAWKLCQQIRETPLVFPVLKGLWMLHDTRAENGRAREFAEQFLTLARRAADPISLSQGYYALGWTLFKLGELVSARTCLEQSISCYPPPQHSAPAFTYGQDTGVNCLSFAALDLWFLGYPDQALQRSQEALALARESSHPYSEAFALCVAAGFHQYRREAQAVRAQVETIVTLSTQYGFPAWSAAGAILGGWVVAEQGWADEGITQMQRGIATWQTIGAGEFTPYWLALLAQAYGKSGQPDEGLRQLAEALTLVDKTGERFYEAELYRLKGELLLTQEIKSQNLEVLDPKSQILNPDPQGEAEVGYQQALAVARKQQAKSLELRASVSLARLWQSQGKSDEARELLEDIYAWFTEGFDTKDLQDAGALLVSLGGTVRTKEESQKSKVKSQKLPIPAPCLPTSFLQAPNS